MVDRSKLNLVIDALMMLCMTAIAGLGFLMKWVLPPGPDRRLKYGRDVDVFLFGIDRHEWGKVHLLIGFVLLGLLMLHIILHWSQIVAYYRRLVAGPTARWVLALVFALVCLFLIAFPLLVTPQVTEGGGHHGQGHADAVSLDAAELARAQGAVCDFCAGCDGGTGARPAESP